MQTSPNRVPCPARQLFRDGLLGPSLVVLFVISGLGVGSANAQDGGEVVYRETFPVPEGEALKLTQAGWKAWVFSPGNAAVNRGAGGYTVLMRPKASVPKDAEPVNAEVADDAPQATGMMVNWNGGDFWKQKTLYFTDEFELDDARRLRGVSWFQNNQKEDAGFRLALKIGTAWIVSDENFVGYTTVKLDVDSMSWRFMNPANLDPDAEATMTELPEGPLKAFGVVGLHTGYAELDTFTLIADPAE